MSFLVPIISSDSTFCVGSLSEGSLFGNSILVSVSKYFEGTITILAKIYCRGQCWQKRVFIVQEEKCMEWDVHFILHRTTKSRGDVFDATGATLALLSALFLLIRTND